MIGGISQQVLNSKISRMYFENFRIRFMFRSYFVIILIFLLSVSGNSIRKYVCIRDFCNTYRLTPILHYFYFMYFLKFLENFFSVILNDQIFTHIKS